jgi:hypothetical protein
MPDIEAKIKYAFSGDYKGLFLLVQSCFGMLLSKREKLLNPYIVPRGASLRLLCMRSDIQSIIRKAISKAKGYLKSNRILRIVRHR